MNIIPEALVRRSASIGELDNLTNIALRNLSAASGGYDFLLQVSNEICATAAFNSLQLKWITGRIDSQAAALLGGTGKQPSSSALHALMAADGSASAGADVLILFEAKDVMFDGAAGCRVRAHVRVALGSFARVPKEPALAHGLSPGEAVQQMGGNAAVRAGNPAALASAAGLARIAAMDVAPHPLQTLGGSLLNVFADTPDFRVGEATNYLAKHIELGERDSFEVTAWLGGGILEISAPFSAMADTGAATITVAADVSASTAVFTDLGHDADLLLDASDPVGLIAQVNRQLRAKGGLALLDQISLVAGSPSTKVNGLSQSFRAEAFPCGTNACPLSVAANIVPWTAGAPTAIRFIGQSGYGVIWSKEGVDLLVRHCWETGWFPRSIPQSTPVKVTIGGNEQMGSAISEIELQTMKTVALEYDSNGRTDVLHTTGTAQVTPRYIQLVDGSQIWPGTPPDPIFEPSEVRVWSAIGTLIEELPVNPASDIEHFERAVTFGTTSRLGRPFCEAVERTVVFSSISAYSQRVLLLVE